MSENNTIDNELWQEALKWGYETYDHMKEACSNPSVALKQDYKKIYNELLSFGWFDTHPIESFRETTAMHLAIQKYGKLKWEKEHVKKPKPTKWEVVTGKAKKR